MKRALIITYYFPPVNIIASKRYGEMAPYMKEFGWEPFILTAKSQGDLKVTIPEENIIRIGENCDSGKKTVVEGSYEKIPLFLKPFYFLYKKSGIKLATIDRFLFSWLRQVLKQEELIRNINPDVIIATSQPAVDLWLGYFLSRKLKKPWIAEFRDPCSLYNTSKFPLAKLIDRKIDKFLIKKASAVITIGPYLSSLLERFYQKPVYTVYNGFNKLVDKEDKDEKEEKIIYYAGRFRVLNVNRENSAKLLIEWLAQNRKSNIRFIIRSLGPEQADKEILSFAKEKKVSDKIDLLCPAPAETIFQEEKNADILAVFEDLEAKELFFRGTMTGKLFEYLAFKAPILAIARPDSDIDSVLKDTGRGCLVSNLEELDKAIKNILAGRAAETNQERLKTYSRRFQCQKLCGLLDNIYGQ